MLGTLLLLGACQDPTTPTPVRDTAEAPGPTPPPVIAAAAGGKSVCVIQEGGSLFCWGNNVRDVETPAENFTSIDGGVYGYCGRTTTGSVHCWGTASDFGDFVEPDAAAFEVGDYAICVLNAEGLATCRGDEYWAWPSTVRVPRDQAFLEIAPSYDGACGLTTEGEAVCYLNGRGDWAPGPPSGTYVKIAVGWEEACVLSDLGAATCWGMNSVARAERFSQITVGPEYACGLTLDQQVRCWPEWSTEPEEYSTEWYADRLTSTYPREGAFVSVDTSSSTGVAVSTDGEVVVFGDWTHATYAEAWFDEDTE